MLISSAISKAYYSIQTSRRAEKMNSIWKSPFSIKTEIKAELISLDLHVALHVFGISCIWHTIQTHTICMKNASNYLVAGAGGSFFSISIVYWATHWNRFNVDFVWLWPFAISIAIVIKSGKGDHRWRCGGVKREKIVMKMYPAAFAFHFSRNTNNHETNKEKKSLDEQKSRTKKCVECVWS